MEYVSLVPMINLDQVCKGIYAYIYLYFLKPDYPGNYTPQNGYWFPWVLLVLHHFRVQWYSQSREFSLGPCRPTPLSPGTQGIPLDPLGPCRPTPLTPNYAFDPLGPCRPTPWPPLALFAYPLTPWDAVCQLLDPLGPGRPNPWPPGTLKTSLLTPWDPVGLPIDPPL